MLQKLVDYYDDSECFIINNKKTVAEDNKTNVGNFITCALIVYALYFIYSWVSIVDISKLIIYLLPMLVFIVQRYCFDMLSPKLNDFTKVRWYSLINYGIIFMVATWADVLMHTNVRCFLMPAAILIISSVYFDRFFLVLTFKFILGIYFIVLEILIKSTKFISGDIALVVMCIIISSFCYFTIMKSGLNRREDNIQLEVKSQTDLLTSLLNKVSFEEKSKEYLSGRIIGAKATLFMFDFNNFKHVNDQYGHIIGDEALKNFSRILRGYFHPTDIIGRVGGDEFMVLVMGEMPTDFIDKRCRAIQHELKTSHIGEASGFSCSIGICEDIRAHNFDEMYAIADSALYEAKENGKACHVIKFGD